MAVVHYKRLNDSSLSGRYGESFQIVEKWEVRTNSPTTSKLAIAGAVPGAYFGAAHPDIPSCKAMEFDVAPVDRSGLLWLLTVRYYVPPPGKNFTESGTPEDVWEGIGGSTVVPAFTDLAGDTIVNSAKDPIEGLTAEREERGWSLTKYFVTNSQLDSHVIGYAGKVNSSTWGGFAAYKWKCYFKGAKKREISQFEGDTDSGSLQYIESHWEFRLEPKTWKCMPWDVGFMELVSSERKVILGDDKKPVKQPVALNSDGTKKSPGTAPDVINSGAGVDLYASADFTSGFGTPAVLS
jgi:hypothetical protein